MSLQESAAITSPLCECINIGLATIVLPPFVRDYPDKPVPEETLTHPPSLSSSSLYQLLPSTTIHSILPVQIACLAIFLHNLCPCPLWYTVLSADAGLLVPLGFGPSTSYSTHFFAVVSILYHLFLIFLSTLYLELYLLSIT